MIGVTGSAAAGISSWTGKRTGHTEQGTAQEDFSVLLDKMKKGQSPSLNSDDGGDPEKTVTVTRVMFDGSTLITVMREGKIVSQSRTHAAKAEDNPRLLDTISQVGAGAGGTGSVLQASEDAGSVAAGYLGGAGVMELMGK